MSGAATSVTSAMATVAMMATALAGGRSMAPLVHETVMHAKASKVVQAVSQTSAAASMRDLESGTTTKGPSGTRSLVREGWLRSVPSNPAGRGLPAMPVVVEGSTGRWVEMRLIDDVDGSLCDVVARQTGMGESAPDPVGAGGSRVGCMRAPNGSVAFAEVS